jgi:hypothetical protein
VRTDTHAEPVMIEGVTAVALCIENSHLVSSYYVDQSVAVLNLTKLCFSVEKMCSMLIMSAVLPCAKKYSSPIRVSAITSKNGITISSNELSPRAKR